MNRITEMLGIKYPIIQGAMQDVAKAGLVAAVSNAGGLGVLASGQDTPEQVREEIRKVKELTDKPFAVNLMFLMTIWRKSPYFSEGMDSLSLGLVESYFLYALYFWSLTYLSTTSLLMLPREPR